MTRYVDSGALLERYIDEHDSVAADELMQSDPVLVTSRLIEVEVRRNLARLLTETTSTGNATPSRSTSTPSRWSPSTRPR